MSLEKLNAELVAANEDLRRAWDRFWREQSNMTNLGARISEVEQKISVEYEAAAHEGRQADTRALRDELRELREDSREAIQARIKFALSAREAAERKVGEIEAKMHPFREDALRQAVKGIKADLRTHFASIGDLCERLNASAKQFGFEDGVPFGMLVDGLPGDPLSCAYDPRMQLLHAINFIFKLRREKVL